MFSFTWQDYFEVVSVVHVFLLLRSIPMYRYITFCLSIHPTGGCQSVVIKNKVVMNIPV